MARVAGVLGGLDVLVNSVGAARGGRFLELGEADWMGSLDSKLHAQIRCCRAALPWTACSPERGCKKRLAPPARNQLR